MLYWCSISRGKADIPHFSVFYDDNPACPKEEKYKINDFLANGCALRGLIAIVESMDASTGTVNFRK